ncbi:hypothetical protein [Allorhodopirellula heiligendammensis]|uniref:Twin-arginine translocation signal domain-containing protein n=1 Tax=Allorhodopirellula heiligendammensis TaxID=2714739 RepID=A0A5C6C5V4_9BACT|nr:hypothetical protein [Allorhodopirellula heiligendammensis]TWU19387.1 hypothetical protein Poly21_15600 [Allorhodopirellula heiligendammensis]
MKRPHNINERRGFLKSAGLAGATLSMTDFGFLGRLPAVSAADTKLPSNAVEFSPDIEPLVRLLEDTPREQVVETFAAKIQSGTSYREVLAALLLAGVRNIQPRPSVGFKFHAVLVVNSAHLASLNSPDSDRWLPIFWALDYFKSSQARDVQEGDWTMSAVDEASVPPSHRAKDAFRAAMDNWDVDAADTAIVALCRTAAAAEVFDMLAHYGCRDYRSIGHKAIYVANAYRTLQCIGWRYAEPVLRSLAYALLNHEGQPNPATHDLAPDAAWRVTQERLASLPAEWSHGRLDAGATRDLLDTLRTASPSDAVAVTADLMVSGVAPQSINDALFLSAAEMLAQQPGIVSLHAATTTNALQYAYRTACGDETRRELLLQNAAFIPYFRESMQGRGNVAAKRINVSDDAGESDGAASVDEIFAAVSSDRSRAAADMQAFLASGGRPESLIHAARRLVFLKGNDAHDYKFSSAALEDFYAVSPQFRNAYLASSAYLLPGSKDRDNGLVDRVRDALA